MREKEQAKQLDRERAMLKEVALMLRSDLVF